MDGGGDHEVEEEEGAEPAALVGAISGNSDKEGGLDEQAGQRDLESSSLFHTSTVRL